MGNFISKEDILVEIAVLFKQLDNGKLTIDELEDLVKLTRELHERALILRYKSFEEKVFGVKPIEEDNPKVEEIIIPEEKLEINDTPITEELFKEDIIEEEDSFEAPLFNVEVKEEPSFGFSLFGDDIDTKEVVETTVTPIEEVNEAIVQSQPQVNTHPESMGSDVISNSTSVESVTENSHEVSNFDRPMSDVERAHAENLERFANKNREQQAALNQSTQDEPVAPSPSAPQFERFNSFFTPKIEPIKEITPEPEEDTFFVEQIIEQTTPLKEEVFQEPVKEEVGEISSFSYSELAKFVTKYNLVDSNLATQFGVTKINSLVGSFGINERLQFINELFDGSSEDFSNAIKVLDTQASSTNARTKLAEIAVSNNWESESDTVLEFMQKVIRRYA